MPDISAISTCEGGCIVQISYEHFSSFLGIGPQTSPIVSYGSWKKRGHNEFQVTLEAELPGNRSQRVHGSASFISGCQRTRGERRSRDSEQKRNGSFPGPR